MASPLLIGRIKSCRRRQSAREGRAGRDGKWWRTKPGCWCKKGEEGVVREGGRGRGDGGGDREGVEGERRGGPGEW